jgi:Glyoxalase-like domain
MARRRYTLLIDVDASGFRKGVRFWSEALGATARHSGDPRDPFIELPAATGDMHIEMQRIGGAGRYHLDLYAPDVDREASRLEALGAQRVKREASWWVMQAPTGHLFCIIPESAPEPDDDDDEEDDFADDEDHFAEDEYDDDFGDDEPPEPEPPKRYPRLRAVPND